MERVWCGSADVECGTDGVRAGFGDGQAEAVAGLVGHAGGVAAVERLDEVGRCFGVCRRCRGVADADGDVLPVVVDGAGDGTVVGVVDDGVAYEVVHGEREVA